MKQKLLNCGKGLVGIVTKSFRFLALCLCALIGKWQPPPWMRWISGKTSQLLVKRPRLIGGLAVVTLLGFFGYQQWQNWWLMHQPRERQLVEIRKVEVTVTAPPSTRWEKDKTFYGNVVFNFSAPAAPLEKIDKVVESGISLKPSIAGSWRWFSEKSLVFQPTEEWQAGSEYTVTMAKNQFAEEIVLSTLEPKFSTLPLTVEIGNYIFYTQPDQAEVHELTATLRTSSPVDHDALVKSITFEALGEAPGLFVAGQPQFTLTAAKQPNLWYFRSGRIAIPSKSVEMKLTVRPGLLARSGGKPTAAEVVAKALVPDKFSALSLTDATTNIVKNAEGEPKQFLNFSSTLDLKAADLLSRIHLWKLTEKDNEWLIANQKGEADVSAEMLSRATELKLERAIQEGESPMSRDHAYQFFTPGAGRLFLSISQGLPGLGGFELQHDFRALLNAPRFPKELEWTGKGNILALQGEKKIQIKSRGIKFVKVTLGRVRAGELNHLVTQNDYGDFSSPALGGNFSEDSLVRSQQFIVRIDKKNDWDACFTAFDMSAALAKVDPSDPDPSRGVFFTQVQEISATLKNPPDTTVLSRVTDPEEYDESGDRADYYQIDESAADVFFMNDDGSPARVVDWFTDVKKAEDLQWSDGEVASQRFIMLTDLGLLIKTNADASRDVFVMSIKGQTPVPNAKVTLLSRNGTTLEEGVTNAEGRSTMSKPKVTAKELQPVAVLVRHGEDLSFVPLRPGQLPALDYSRYDTGGVLNSRTLAVEAQVFCERGIYRPGDAIHFGAVVRRRDWQAVIEGLPLQAALRDSEGNQVAVTQMKLQRDGLLEGELKTSELSPTGVYELSLWVMNMEMNATSFLLGRTALRIEDFRPDRLKMKVALEPELPKGWVKPVEMKAMIDLENLFGVVAADRRVTGTMELSRAEFSFSEWPGYEFNGVVDPQSIAGKVINLGEVKTDVDGKAAISLPLANIGKANISVDVKLEAFETDGGHGVRESRHLLVSPWDFVVGYKSDGKLDYLGKDSACAVKFIALDPDLKSMAVQGLKYRITQKKYVSVLRKQDNGSMVYESQQRNLLVEERKDISWAAGDVNMDIDTSKVGQFFLEVVNANDEVVCRISYNIIGKGNEQRSLDRDAELTIKLSQSEALAGSKVDVSIVAPYAGAGLITLEREKVLYSQWFKADTTASVQTIPIPEGLEGTVYCNVSFVRSLDSAEIMMSPLSYAAEPISIKPVKRQLNVVLEAPKLLKPGQKLTVGYRTSQKSRIIVYAVDEGIHRITDYKRPEPLHFFFRKQALEVRTQQWFDLLLPEYHFLAQNAAFGGDGEGREALNLNLNPFKRKRDAPVVWWAGILEAGPDRRETSWTVPDYFDGSLNIMAVAVNETSAGGAETKCMIRSPLVLTANTPVYVAPGDEFVTSLTVSNNMDKEGPSEVTLVITPSEHLQIIGESKAIITVEKGREATARFRVKAVDHLGGASLKFSAQAAAESSVRTETLSVRPAVPFRTQVRSGYFRTKTHEETISRSLYDGFRRCEVMASPVPLVLANGLQGYMQTYPHACSEQLSSKGLVLLACRDMKSLGLKSAKVNGDVEQTINTLQSRQGASGGFGYWDAAATDADAFLACYVSHFLIESKEAGLAIPALMYDRALKRLRAIAMAGEPKSLHQADVQAYAIYLLIRKGEQCNGLASLRESVERVFKDKWQNRLCGHLIGSCYALQQKKDEAEKIAKLWRPAKAGEYKNGENYWSHIEVDALLCFDLRARHFPDTVKNYGYADWQKLYGVIWEQRFNTLTASYAALGMRDFAKVAAANTFHYEIDELPADGSKARPLLKSDESYGKASFSADMKALQFRIKQTDSDLGMFYQVVEEGFDKSIPATVQRDGLDVHREILDAKGKPVPSVKVGDAVTMRLRVRNVSQLPAASIALIDLLPGGFTIEPGALIPGSGTVPGTERADLREDRNLFYLSLHGAEEVTINYSLRAVCAGDFVVPPLFAESMYDRGINGRGLGARITVVPRE